MKSTDVILSIRWTFWVVFYSSNHFACIFNEVIGTKKIYAICVKTRNDRFIPFRGDYSSALLTAKYDMELDTKAANSFTKIWEKALRRPATIIIFELSGSISMQLQGECKICRRNLSYVVCFWAVSTRAINLLCEIYEAFGRTEIACVRGIHSRNVVALANINSSLFICDFSQRN